VHRLAMRQPHNRKGCRVQPFLLWALLSVSETLQRIMDFDY
jgi:hypothetical protein